jgi:hypothetical protein
VNAWVDARYIMIKSWCIYIYVTYIIYNTYIYYINKTIHIIICMMYIYICIVLMGFIWIWINKHDWRSHLVGFDEVLTNQTQMLHGAGRFTYKTGSFLG